MPKPLGQSTTDDSADGHAQHRWLLGLEALALLALFGFLALTALRIVRDGARQELHPADAIVVFGAAEYAGHPSPVLTTGGAASDPSFSEGGVSHDYLEHRGIPERDLIAETQGSDTAQSAVRIAVIMRANGLHSCIAVSDAYHVFRIKRLLEHEGVGPVYVAPRPDSRPRGKVQRAFAVFRESCSYLLWKLGMS